MLTPVQSFVVASVSAAVLAVPFALQWVPNDQGGLIHNLFWPDALNAYIAFPIFLISIIPALLGYYHLGRLGFLVNVAAGFALAWFMAVCWIFCFVYIGHYSGSLWLVFVAYALCVVLVYLLIARLHLRAATYQSVRDAQRKLHLIPNKSDNVIVGSIG